MKNLLLVLAVMAAIALVANLIKSNAKRARGTIKKNCPLTEREQAMYFRLKSALPEYVVLSQVAFSAMLKATDVGTRNTFDRKRADFVICSKAFEVVAVIELDDASHKGREAQDRKRDSLLRNAGMAVLRYKNVPDESIVRTDIAALASAKVEAA